VTELTLKPEVPETMEITWFSEAQTLDVTFCCVDCHQDVQAESGEVKELEIVTQD